MVMGEISIVRVERDIVRIPLCRLNCLGEAESFLNLKKSIGDEKDMGFDRHC